MSDLYLRSSPGTSTDPYLRSANDRSSVAGIDTLYSADLAVGTVAVDAPTIGQVHSISGADMTSGAPIIRFSGRTIDHTNFDPSTRSNAEITAAAGLKVYFEHASTGEDIVGDSDTDSSTGTNYNDTESCGLAELYALNNRYLCGRESYNSSNSPTWFATNTGLQDNHRGNPTPATKISGFVGMSNDLASAVDVAMWKYCWIDAWPATSGYISDGAAAAASDIADIEAFETAHPGLIVVWWTMPLQSSESYAAREAYNDAIRTYCDTNNKWLLDIADLECHNDAGVKQTDGNGREIAVSSYMMPDGGHLGSTGRVKLARAYWEMLARIAAEQPAASTNLTGADVTAGAVAVDAPTVGQVHDLTGAGVTTSTVAIDAPTIGQTHDIAGADATSGAVTVDAPSIGQVHGLAGADVTGNIPTLDAPTLSSFADTDALTGADLLGGVAAIDAPALAQIHALSVGSQVVVVAIDEPSIFQYHNLVSQSVSLPSNIETPILGSGSNHDILVGEDVVSGIVSIGLPVLGATSKYLESRLISSRITRSKTVLSTIGDSSGST